MARYKSLVKLLHIYACLKRIKSKKVKKNKRKYFRHPLNEKFRNAIGYYNNLCVVLRQYPDRFKSFFSMKVETFDLILDEIMPALVRKSARAFPPGMRLFVYLRYLFIFFLIIKVLF